MRNHEDKIDLLAIDDFQKNLPDLIDWALRIKNGEGLVDEFKPLEGMSIGSIYEKPSTRTRVSFEVGVSKLGGQPVTLLSNDIQLGKSESIADTAAVLSRFLDGITYRCFKHQDVVELAKHSTIPVINALSDLHHPCQAAADLMTITEHKKKVNGHISWVGDGNNVFHDLLLASVSMGHDVSYATPVGFEPDSEILIRAKKIADETGAKVIGTNDPIEAVTDAGVIYTDIFVSMGEEHIKDKFQSFEGFQINNDLASYADQDYLFMHCLPAHRGEEVTDGVIDSKNSVVFDQAENRMWAQMSLLTYMCNENAWHSFNELY